MNRLTHGPGCEKAPTIWATKTLVEMFSNYFYEKVTTICSTINVKSSEINFATNVNTNKDI